MFHTNYVKLDPAMIFWVGLLVSLPLPASQSCTTGSVNECKEAEFAPGTDLAGEGFDITKMQRKGAYVINLNSQRGNNETCTICENPYLKGKMQKLPLSVVDWRPNHKCSMKVSSSFHESSESLVSSISKSVNNDWGVDLNVNHPIAEGKLMLAGTQSKLAEYSMEKTKKDKFSFASHQVSCRYYSCRLSTRPPLHPEFQQEVEDLPVKYDSQTKQHYYKLIDTYGTHYISKVELGGSVHSVTSIRQCLTELQGLSVEEVKMCLDVEAAASVGDKANLQTEYKHCTADTSKNENKASFSSTFNDRHTEIRGGHTTEPELLFSATKDPGAYKDWMASLPLSPDIVSYSLEALHKLLPTSNPVSWNLQQAISHYILEKSLWKNCSSPCPVGVKTHPKDTCICSCHNNPGVTPNCCPKNRGLARVKVTVQRAMDLWGDYDTCTDGYVKLFHFGEQVGRTRIIYNTNHPNWNESSNLGSVALTIDDHVKFEVWDEDSKWDDDLLGQCSVKLVKGVTEDLCKLSHGQLFYKVEVECAPSLAGPACADYVGSPMNNDLAKVYVSRHAHPVPKEMLLKMGVLVDQHPLYANQHLSNGGQN